MGALAQVQNGGVAYMAHVGGFIFGAVMSRIFETRQRREQEGLDEIQKRFDVFCQSHSLTLREIGDQE
jgi:membrane associated rhomboid family serine protease